MQVAASSIVFGGSYGPPASVLTSANSSSNNAQRTTNGRPTAKAFSEINRVDKYGNNNANLIVVGQILSIQYMGKQATAARNRGMKIRLLDRSSDYAATAAPTASCVSVSASSHSLPSRQGSGAGGSSNKVQYQEIELIVFRSMLEKHSHSLQEQAVIEIWCPGVDVYDTRYPGEPWMHPFKLLCGQSTQILSSVGRGARQHLKELELSKEECFSYCSVLLSDLREIASLMDRKEELSASKQLLEREKQLSRSFVVRIDFVSSKERGMRKLSVSDHSNHSMNVVVTDDAIPDGVLDRLCPGDVVMLHRFRWEPEYWSGALVARRWFSSDLSIEGYQKHPAVRERYKQVRQWATRRNITEQKLQSAGNTNGMVRLKETQKICEKSFLDNAFFYRPVESVRHMMAEMYMNVSDTDKVHCFELPARIVFSDERALVVPGCTECLCKTNYIPSIRQWCCTNSRLPQLPRIQGETPELQRNLKHVGHLSSDFVMRFSAPIQLSDHTGFLLRQEQGLDGTILDPEEDDQEQDDESTFAAADSKRRKIVDTQEEEEQDVVMKESQSLTTTPTRRRRSSKAADVAVDIDNDIETAAVSSKLANKSFSGWASNDAVSQLLFGCDPESWATKTLEDQQRFLFLSQEAVAVWKVRCKVRWDPKLVNRIIIEVADVLWYY